jgi:hypothetical protein
MKDTDPLLANGFEFVNGVLGPNECTEHAQLASGPAAPRTLLSQAWCLSLATLLRSKLQLRSRLGFEPVAVQCTYFEKSAQRNGLVALHQDVTVPVASRVESQECRAWSKKDGALFVRPPLSVLESLLAVRVHLDESTVQNGALRVVPRSHRVGVLSPADAAAQRAREGEVICAAPRGSAMLMKPLLLHASSKGTGEEPRRVLHFLFGPSSLPHGLAWPNAGCST